MKVTAETIDAEVLRIKLEGRLDSEGSGLVETKLAAYMGGDGRKVIIDLAGVTFLASLGIRLFLINAKALHKRGGKVALFNPTDEVSKVIRMVGVDNLIPLCADEAAAKAAVTS